MPTPQEQQKLDAAEANRLANKQARERAKADSSLIQAVGFQDESLSQGVQIRDEIELEAKREELKAAGIVESDFGNFISSPQPGETRLFFRQPAILTGPSGEKKIVASGSQEANDLLKAGWTLGDTVDDTVISSSTMSEEPTINIGDDEIPNTFTSDTVEGGFDATISAANDEIKRLQKLLIDEAPETESSKELDDLIAGLDPDSLTGRGATQLAEEEKREIEAKTQALISKTAELKRKRDEITALTASFNLLNKAEEGKHATLSLLRGAQGRNFERYLLQKNSLTADAAFIQSDLFAMQNQLQASQDAANRAVDLMFADREAKYTATIAKINILEPQVEGDEDRYLAQIKLDLQNQQVELAEAKADKKGVQALKIDYIETMLKAGKTPDPGVLSDFSNIQTVDEAINLFAKSAPQATNGNVVIKPINLSTSAKTKLVGAGFSKEDISEIEKSVNDFGIEVTLRAIDPSQRAAVADAYDAQDILTNIDDTADALNEPSNIDPDLRKRLEEQGETETIKELEEAAKPPWWKFWK